jgi:RNA polymerase sigma factor (sigma-70 family)
MATRAVHKVLEHLRRSLPSAAGLSDGQLLARFVAGHDEAAFATLVRRHGSMVLGVCLRLLRHHHDAEDAFQATFLLLARKAASLADGESVGGWLYGVAYRTALEARAVNARRRARERQVDMMPHPVVLPAEPQEWRPLLDRELSRLPARYKAPVVLCDLEGLTRKAAAVQLGLPEGTLSSRLATARRMLAKRLSRYGLAVSGGGLATALAQGAPAAVPAPLTSATIQAAVLLAAGPAVPALTPAAALMKEVLKTMFLTKLKVAVTAVMAVAVLGASGLVYRAAGQGGPGSQADAGRPRTEVEALRRENELLKFNLELVLEKCRAQEAELREFRAHAAARQDKEKAAVVARIDQALLERLSLDVTGLRLTPAQLRAADPTHELEAVLKAFRKAGDDAARRHAAEQLEAALKKLRQQLEPADKAPRK